MAARKSWQENTVTEQGLDDVFSDDITVPATDGYPLAATLFLPRGVKRHAVLINSATAVPENSTAALPAISPSAAVRF